MYYNCGYWPFKSVRFSSFQVSNMDADIPYKFNIVNCEKINSQFNFGKLVFMSNRISIFSYRLFMTLIVSYVFFKLLTGSRRTLASVSQSEGHPTKKSVLAGVAKLTKYSESLRCFLNYGERISIYCRNENQSNRKS